MVLLPLRCRRRPVPNPLLSWEIDVGDSDLVRTPCPDGVVARPFGWSGGCARCLGTRRSCGARPPGARACLMRRIVDPSLRLLVRLWPRSGQSSRRSVRDPEFRVARHRGRWRARCSCEVVAPLLLFVLGGHRRSGHGSPNPRRSPLDPRLDGTGGPVQCERSCGSWCWLSRCGL